MKYRKTLICTKCALGKGGEWPKSQSCFYYLDHCDWCGHKTGVVEIYYWRFKENIWLSAEFLALVAVGLVATCALFFGLMKAMGLAFGMLNGLSINFLKR